VFDAGNDKDDEAEESKNIDDMTIDVGNGRDTDASVLQQETIINRAANTTELTIEKD